MCEYTDEDYARNVMLDDLQLAAELGKTLLERNKELEISLKQHQTIIDDQTQEIEYLTKQVVALREVNDSRLRIYEQLEVSIQDLERANHRLVLENSSDKKIIKTINATVDALEAKVEELQSTNDDLKLQLDILKRKSQRNNEALTPTNSREIVTLRHVDRLDEDSVDSTVHNDEYGTPSKPTELSPSTLSKSLEAKNDERTNQMEEWENDNNMEQMAQLLSQLSKTRAQCSRDERRISELEEQLKTLVQQNQALENQVVQLSHKEDDLNMKSMHEELTTLEEVRQGQMCSRCLRSMEQNDMSDMHGDDDSSMLEGLIEPQYHSSFSMDVQDNSLEEILQRELSVSVLWISPTMNLVSLLFDLCMYLKDAILIPLLEKPLKVPFILFHYCLKHKLH